MFLVELRASGSGFDDVERMHGALRHAVSRRAASGAMIDWAGGLLVPSERRCLCLVEAAEEHDVLRARDIAGLHAAPVRPAFLLPHPPGHVSAEPDEGTVRHERSGHDT
jgi:hypothetical protein